MKHSQVETNGITLDVVGAGGQASLFLPGVPQHVARLAIAVESTVPRGLPPHIDGYVRGCGKSSALPERDACTVPHTVGDLVGLLDAL
ncbi:hypothetical protein QTH89_26870 [Variovorax sp. J22G21]|uniref:hypothetical protein n=1 Tax=Variovorax fucosicus TaxID=3053517 RepID=UPI002575A570|nr:MULTISPECIES: hypothetical protein [unclassified Variovorax]MDM0042806.1 hypothetical protein [Variovorax sp. J22R193]MDM0064863.1 hypothetical protein [Variovorax sp. J22G21]